MASEFVSFSDTILNLSACSNQPMTSNWKGIKKCNSNKYRWLCLAFPVARMAFKSPGATLANSGQRQSTARFQLAEMDAALIQVIHSGKELHSHACS